MKHRPILLVVMDGWGHREETRGNAIAAANTPNYDQMLNQYPNCLLGASGNDVGLPEFTDANGDTIQQIGSSEVGHLNLGGGRRNGANFGIVSKAFETGDFQQNPAVLSALDNHNPEKAIHLVGMVSDGGVHSHISHLIETAKFYTDLGIPVKIHAIADGRDVPPASAAEYMQQLEAALENMPLAKIVTLSGRQEAMDRDKRWDNRTAKTYQVMVTGEGENLGISFDLRVGKLCEQMAADGLSTQQKESLANAINALLDSKSVPPLTAETIGQSRDFLVESITAQYPNSPDKLDAFLDALASHMGEGYPVEIKKSDLGTVQQTIATLYERGITDEYFPSCVVDDDYTGIEDGEGIVFIGFRADRMKQLPQALLEQDFQAFERTKVPQFSFALSMTPYFEPTVSNTMGLTPLYIPEILQNTLGEVIAQEGGKQLRLTETQKKAHATYFLDGGSEELPANTDTVILRSPEQCVDEPAMQSVGITNAAITALESSEYSFIMINYPNGDMVGHTGDFAKTVEAVEAVDTAIGRLITTVGELDNPPIVIICADHGNADELLDENGEPVTKHSLSSVPCIMIDTLMFGKLGEREHEMGAFTANGGQKGVLASVAPTLLRQTGREIPQEMTEPPLEMLLFKVGENVVQYGSPRNLQHCA
jgi:bisphosphoglycerate-independent phosphoglycerate mutase (AlkP superfamily)